MRFRAPKAIALTSMSAATIGYKIIQSRSAVGSIAQKIHCLAREAVALQKTLYDSTTVLRHILVGARCKVSAASVIDCARNVRVQIRFSDLQHGPFT